MRRTGLAAWLGLLGPPAAWTFQLVAGYGLEELACSPATHGDEIAGLAVEPLVAAVSAAAALLALASLAAAAALRRATSRGRVEDPRGRLGFMAAAGLLGGLLFLVLIVLGGVQLLRLDACAPV